MIDTGSQALCIPSKIKDGQYSDQQNASEEDGFFPELEFEFIIDHTNPNFSTATWAATWLASFLL